MCRGALVHTEIGRVQNWGWFVRIIIRDVEKGNERVTGKEIKQTNSGEPPKTFLSHGGGLVA